MAEHVAQRIEACVRDDREGPPITVSIGMAVYPGDGRTSQDLLEAADQQLYGRKKKGRSSNATDGQAKPSKRMLGETSIRRE
jgi:GGDEF domain-containing protein